MEDPAILKPRRTRPVGKAIQVITTALAVMVTLAVLTIKPQKTLVPYAVTPLERFGITLAFAAYIPGILVGRAMGLPEGENPWAWRFLMVSTNGMLGLVFGTLLAWFIRFVTPPPRTKNL